MCTEEEEEIKGSSDYNGVVSAARWNVCCHLVFLLWVGGCPENNGGCANAKGRNCDLMNIMELHGNVLQLHCSTGSTPHKEGRRVEEH